MYRISILSIFVAVMLLPSLAEARTPQPPTHTGLYGHHRRSMTLNRPTRRHIVETTRREMRALGASRTWYTNSLAAIARSRMMQRQQARMKTKEVTETEDETNFRNIYPGRRLRYGGPQNVLRSKHLYFNQIPAQGY